MADVTALLPTALAGDRQAQDQLYRLVEPDLRQLAWHWLRRYSAKERVQVSDVLDRVFLKLMKVESPGWEHRGQFYAFACRNLPCVLIDLLRDQDRHKKLRGDQADAQPGLDALPEQRKGLSEASLGSLSEALEDLGKDLSPNHRRVIELKYFGEFTLDEIAEITGIHRSTVDRMLAVSRGYLRDRLESGFPDLAAFTGESPPST
jgi:RNA polymerase sigma factor (TIGR02999 family)